MHSSEEFNLNYKFSDEKQGSFLFNPPRRMIDFGCQVNLCNNAETPISIEEMEMALAASDDSNAATGTCSTAVSDAGVKSETYLKMEIKTEEPRYKNEHDPGAIKKLKQQKDPKLLKKYINYTDRDLAYAQGDYVL
jgi:hypothetical protein